MVPHQGPGDVNSSTLDALATAHLAGEGAPVSRRQYGLHQWEGVDPLRGLGDRRVAPAPSGRQIGKGGRRILQCCIDRRRATGELGVLGFHLVDQGEIGGPDPPRPGRSRGHKWVSSTLWWTRSWALKFSPPVRTDAVPPSRRPRPTRVGRGRDWKAWWVAYIMVKSIRVLVLRRSWRSPVW